MSDKFLIDECLSLGLVRVALARSFQAHHVAHMGMSGQTDWRIAARALEHGYTLVTNNGKDFLKIYAGYPRHHGLVIIVPQVRAIEQTYLFDLALDEFGRRKGLVNQTMIVDGDGAVTVHEKLAY